MAYDPCIIAFEQRALRVGATSAVANFGAENLRDTRLDRLWISTSLTSQYIEFATGGTVFGTRASSTAVSANLRGVDFHPTAAWVVLVESTQLVIRSWDKSTGTVGTTNIDTQAQPSGQAWLAAKFSPNGRFILATCESDGSGATVRLRHFDPATGQIGASITIPSAETEAPETGQRGLVWAKNSLGFAMLGNDDLNVWSFNTTTAVATFVQSRDLGASSANCLDWHPSVATTSYIVVGHENSPHLGKFDVTLTAGVPTAVSTVTAIGASPGTVVSVAFSPTGDRLLVATSTPSVVMYPFTTTFGTAWSAPATQIASTRNSALWTLNGNYVILGGGGVDDPDVYPVTASAWGTKDTVFWDTPDAYQNCIAIDATGDWFASITSAGVLQITALDDAPADPEPVRVIALIGVNFTRTAQIRVRFDTQRDMASGSATDSGTIAAFDTTNISQKLFDFVKRLCDTNMYWIADADITKRFCRIDLTDTAQTEPGFRVKYLFASVPLNSERNIGPGADPAPLDPSEVSPTDGEADVLKVRNGRRQMQVKIEALASSTVYDDYWMWVMSGITQGCLFLPTRTNKKRNHQLGFWGRPQRPAAIPWVEADTIDLSVPLVEWK